MARLTVDWDRPIVSAISASVWLVRRYRIAMIIWMLFRKVPPDPELGRVFAWGEPDQVETEAAAALAAAGLLSDAEPDDDPAVAPAGALETA